MNNNLNFQNYSHYKLPITFNPLNYGKLFEQIGSKFILQLITRNIVIINQTDNTNFVKLYRNGDLMLEWKDIKISETSFTRILFDQKFTFENDRLISTEILSVIYWFILLIMKIYNLTPFLYKKDIIKNLNITL